METLTGLICLRVGTGGRHMFNSRTDPTQLPIEAYLLLQYRGKK